MLSILVVETLSPCSKVREKPLAVLFCFFLHTRLAVTTSSIQLSKFSRDKGVSNSAIETCHGTQVTFIVTSANSRAPVTAVTHNMLATVEAVLCRNRGR